MSFGATNMERWQEIMAGFESIKGNLSTKADESYWLDIGYMVEAIEKLIKVVISRQSSTYTSPNQQCEQQSHWLMVLLLLYFIGQRQTLLY